MVFCFFWAKSLVWIEDLVRNGKKKYKNKKMFCWSFPFFISHFLTIQTSTKCEGFWVNPNPLQELQHIGKKGFFLNTDFLSLTLLFFFWKKSSLIPCDLVHVQFQLFTFDYLHITTLWFLDQSALPIYPSKLTGGETHTPLLRVGMTTIGISRQK